MKKGRLFLVPAALSEHEPQAWLPSHTLQEIHTLTHFIAERAKTARHYLKSIRHPKPMDQLFITELNKHEGDDPAVLLAPCLEGQDTGLVSEAGVPAVADPGGIIVRKAHELGIEVLPLLGPSSLLLALMASGMNGQRFVFHGYLSRDDQELARELKQLENQSKSQSMTQMFIETPYRNEKMISALLKNLQPQTDLCIAANITAPDQFIVTRSVAEWKKSKINIDRKPSVFLIFSGKMTA